jgi:hypothetical protein
VKAQLSNVDPVDPLLELIVLEDWHTHMRALLADIDSHVRRRQN